MGKKRYRKPTAEKLGDEALDGVNGGQGGAPGGDVGGYGSLCGFGGHAARGCAEGLKAYIQCGRGSGFFGTCAVGRMPKGGGCASGQAEPQR